MFGLVFIVAGLAFKLGAAPFHMWVPDVYQGAPTAVTLLISGAPKLAAFGITFRILVEGLSGLADRLAADADRAVGGVDGARQPRRHRAEQPQAPAGLFGHRAAGLHAAGLHADVINVNTLSAANGYSSALFYMVTYVLTTLGTFGLIMVLSRSGFESEEISDLAGLSKRSPWIAGVMAMFMFSLAGIPPHGRLLREVRRAAGAGHAPTSWHTSPGGGRRAAVADRRVLLPAHRQDDVLRRAGRPARRPGRSGAPCCWPLNGGAVLLLGMLPGGLMALCRKAIVRALAT